MTTMEWTKEKPTKPGFYFFFEEGFSKEIWIAQLIEDGLPLPVLGEWAERGIGDFNNCWWLGPLDVHWEDLKNKLACERCCS
ncbi:MAG: hypothetical protein M1438_09650 [Deltaproteobacteria bacterium]|nr:hypothetical protein [Deltaproteobacteria bacterium]